jgi:DNA-binding beta-propeller fold protein YncE
MRANPILALTGLMTALALGAACLRKSDPPQKPPPPPLEYLGEWGPRGDGPGQLKDPVALARDAAGLIYATDGATGFVHKFNGQGRPLLSFKEDRVKGVAIVPSDAGRRGGTRYSLAAIAVDRGGAIYVLGPAGSRVLMSYPDGEPLRAIRVDQSRPSQQPTGIAVDDEGNLFVVESRSSRIRMFNRHSRLSKSWGRQGHEAGEFSHPTRICVGPDGFLYVADSGNARVQKFTRNGRLVSVLRLERTRPDQEHSFAGLCVSEKYVFVADSADQRVHIWALDGRYLLAADIREPLLMDSLYPTEETPLDIVLVAKDQFLVVNPSKSNILRFILTFKPDTIARRVFRGRGRRAAADRPKLAYSDERM